MEGAKSITIQFFITMGFVFQAMDDMGDVFDNHNISTVAALSFTSKNEVPQKMKKLKVGLITLRVRCQ